MATKIHDISKFILQSGGQVDYMSGLIFILFLYFLYYFTNIRHKPSLACSKYGKFRNRLLQYITELDRDFFPLIWCTRPLLQTVLNALFKQSVHHDFQREIVYTDDGGNFTLDWYHDGDINDDNSFVLILPGATGHSEKYYIRQMISSILESKLRCVVLNSRGLGRNVKLTSPVLGCVTRGNDIEISLNIVKKRYPQSSVIGCAYSIGSCVLYNYLARKGSSVPSNLIGAFTMAVPWSPRESKHQLSKFWNNLVINKHMTGELKKIIKNNMKIFERSEPYYGYNIQDILKSQTVWDFDDTYTCPMFGYKNHEEFYKDAAVEYLPLENIRVPVLCVNADDDPMCRRKAIPFKKILENPLLAVITTRYGGHMAWLEGVTFTKKRIHHRIFQQYAHLLLNESTY